MLIWIKVGLKGPPSFTPSADEDARVLVRFHSKT